MQAMSPLLLIGLLSRFACCVEARVQLASPVNYSANALTAASPQVRPNHMILELNDGLDNDSSLDEHISRRRSPSRMVRLGRATTRAAPGLSTKRHLPRRHRRADRPSRPRLERRSTARSILGANIPLPAANLRRYHHGTRDTGQACRLVRLRHAESLQPASRDRVRGDVVLDLSG